MHHDDSPTPARGRLAGSANLSNVVARSTSPRHHSSPRRHSSPARHPVHSSSSPQPHHSSPALRGNSSPPRLHHVPSRRVRKTPPEVDAIRASKKLKISQASGSRGRVTTRDFEDLGRAILKGAFGHFESRLCTEWPYPDEDREVQWARRAWARANSDKGTDVELMPEALRLVSYFCLYNNVQVTTGVL
jgi:hypothetical protein